MGSSSNTVGSIIGVAVVVLVAGWFGYNHFAETKDDRLPLKLKQNLANFQKRLPIEIQPGLVLEYYNFNRTSIEFVLEIKTVRFNQANRSLRQARLEASSRIWLCNWRNKFLGKAKMKISVKILDGSGTEVASVVNTASNCNQPPTFTPQENSL